MTWQQGYLPLGGLLPSALVAAIPLVVLLGSLGLLQLKAHWAALLGLIAALAIAIALYAMPIPLAAASALYGAAYGLFPIGWIVVGAIFVYDITVHTGRFAVLKSSITSLVQDRRIQTLLIAFSFGAFIEGAAGFGTPVAVSAAMLIGLGFRPLQAAALALIGNTAPVAFGAMGTPILALASVTGLPILALSQMVGRQLAFFGLLIPFWLVWAMSGWKGTKEVWPACLVSGLSFALVQFLVSNTHGPWLVGIAAAVASLLSLVVLLRFWQPRRVWRFPGEEPANSKLNLESARFSRKEQWGAWFPWVLLCVLVFTWGLPGVKDFLNSFSSISIEVPLLHQAVWKMPPVVAKPMVEDALFTFNWLSATGTSLLLTGVLSGLILKLKPRNLLVLFLGTLRRVRFSLLTIASMLALGFVTRYAGLETTLGLAFASTGVLFPFFSPILGWLGVALTGSDTSSNVLFGNLQQITAQQVGVSPLLAAAANSAGGVMGKMIDAQSIVVAGVATQQQGGEGSILRYVFFHSVVLAVLVGIMVLLQAYVFPGMIP
jgi:lactate permease